MDAGTTTTTPPPKRWPRGQKFTLSAAGEAAELGHRDAVNGARASGRAALQSALAAWAAPLAVQAGDGVVLVELRGQKKGLNDLARAAKGVRKEGATVQFLPPLEGVPVGAGTSNLWLSADGTLSTTKPPQRDLRGTARIEQLSSPVAGVLPVSISVAWPGTATYQGGKWTKNEGSVSTLQYLVLPE